MKTTDIILLGGAGLAAYLFLSPSTTGSSLIPGGTPAAPAVFNFAYYIQYQYPAMLAQNPNLGNAGYSMTDAEASQYLYNYLDLQQGLSLQKGNINDNARAHWHEFGCAERRSFLPFTPPDRTGYVAPPSNNQSSGGSNWETTALKAAGIIVALLGVNDQKLSDYEIALLFTGAPIALDILPFYYGVPGGLGLAAEDKIKTLLEQYAS